jgi:hypothetical protein
MSYEAEVALRYRRHAEELRTIADADRHEQTRGMLIKVARDYESMAVTMDAIDRTHRKIAAIR